MAGTNDAKRELRRTMRAVRRAASTDPARSAAIVARLAVMPEVAEARTIMMFEPVLGEPDLRGLADRLADRRIVVPTSERDAAFPVEPETVDVVLVPGVAFTAAGDRLGQGVGWYDRFLASAGPNCTTIGVCFDEQVIDQLPVEPHDVPVDWLVTPTSVTSCARHNS